MVEIIYFCQIQLLTAVFFFIKTYKLSILVDEADELLLLADHPQPQSHHGEALQHDLTQDLG